MKIVGLDNILKDINSIKSKGKSGAVYFDFKEKKLWTLETDNSAIDKNASIIFTYSEKTSIFDILGFVNMIDGLSERF